LNFLKSDALPRIGCFVRAKTTVLNTSNVHHTQYCTWSSTDLNFFKNRMLRWYSTVRITYTTR
jgi:hypothetical protein